MMHGVYSLEKKEFRAKNGFISYIQVHDNCTSYGGALGWL